MAHVGEECGFQFIRLFRTVLGGNQFRLHLFPFGDNQRRAHQGQRLIVLVVGFYGGLGLHPVEVFVSVGMIDDAVFLLDFLDTSLNQVCIGLFHFFQVFLVYFGEILAVGYGQLFIVHDTGIIAELYRLVDIAEYGVCPEVPFPWYDVGNVECHGKFPVCRPQLYLGVVQLGAVNAEDVHVFAIVACLDYNVVESVYLFVIIGEGYGTFLLQCNIHEMEELVHGFGK